MWDVTYWGPVFISGVVYSDPAFDYTTDVYLSEYEDCYHDINGTLVCFIDGSWYNVYVE